MSKQLTEQQELNAADDPLSSEVAKHLTHVDAVVREKTVQRIIKYLKLREKTVGRLDDLEFQRLWKALYYCFWLTDKVPIQLEMGETLAKLSQSFQRMDNLNAFFLNFFYVLRREWTGLDYLRMNKYLAWIRQMIHEWFVVLQSRNFAQEEVETFAECIREQVILPTQPDGLRMHVAYVYLPELAYVAGSSLDEPTLRELLSPFLCVLIVQTSDAFFQAVVKDVFEPLLANEFVRPNGETVSFKNLDLYKLGSCIFDMAAEQESITVQRRKALYTLGKKMENQARKNGTPIDSDKSVKRIRTSSADEKGEIGTKVEEPQKRSRTASVESNGSTGSSKKTKGSGSLPAAPASSASSKSSGSKAQEQGKGEKKVVEASAPKQSKAVAVLHKMLKAKPGDDVVEAVKSKFSQSALEKTPEEVPTKKQKAETAAPSKSVTSSAKTKAAPADNGSASAKQQKKAVGDVERKESSEALNESVLSTSSTASKKNVRFSHKDIVRIPTINKRMKENQKTAADLGKPSKSLLKKTSSVSSSSK